MLKIVIVCGGTGSIALQHGLDSILGNKNIQLDIVINAYDNGKSTGVCRKVFDGKILGPSDMRKNQLTSFEILNKDKVNDANSYEYKLYNLFVLRFSGDDYEDYYNKAKGVILNSVFLDSEKRNLMIQWLNYFFFEDMSTCKWREQVKTVEFKDFSLSNIFYSACAAQNDNLLGKAGTIIANLLNIPDNIHLISDISLFLEAKTESGHIIEDEGTIVEWDNSKDKIAEDLLFYNGAPYIPEVDEKNVTKVSSIFKNADIIIFSSGTQWSSLIPTYMHKGFKELLNSSKAKKYLVVNNIHDHDMHGVDLEQLVLILSKYLPVDTIKFVINSFAEKGLNSPCENIQYLLGQLSELGNSKHIPEKLVGLILADYYHIKKKLE